MTPDEPFPLEQFPSRIRAAILDEFDGRRPSQQEVADIPDAHWLATPAIGPAVLKKIRRLGRDDAPPSRPMADAELLQRLTFLQEELKLIQHAVRRVLPQRSREVRRLRHGSVSSSPRGLLPLELSLSSEAENGGDAPLSA